MKQVLREGTDVYGKGISVLWREQVSGGENWCVEEETDMRRIENRHVKKRTVAREQEQERRKDEQLY